MPHLGYLLPFQLRRGLGVGDSAFKEEPKLQVNSKDKRVVLAIRKQQIALNNYIAHLKCNKAKHFNHFPRENLCMYSCSHLFLHR